MTDNYNQTDIYTFDRGWLCYSAFDKSESTDIAMQKDGTTAELIVEKRQEALKKYMYTTPIECGGSYHLRVGYEVVKIRRQLSVYGLATLYNSENKITRRLYLRHTENNILELEFASENEAFIRIELGLKQAGHVIWNAPKLTKSDPVLSRRLKVAAVHLVVPNGIPYEENLKRVEKAFDNAANQGADLLAFAETIGDRGTDRQYFETDSGVFCTLMGRKAVEHKCYVFFTFHELDVEGKRHNTAILLNRKGEVVGKYLKTHLSLREYENGMIPGDEYPVFDTEFGKIGMLICWDTYFPEPAKALTQKGAEIILVSTAGNPTYRHIARAMENGVYMVVSCAASIYDSDILPTKIIDPSGKLLAHTINDMESAIADIDLSRAAYRHWLSVGDADTVPNTVYMNEYRDDLC